MSFLRTCWRVYQGLNNVAIRKSWRVWWRRSYAAYRLTRIAWGRE